jgi:eukaryotic-like serine/threonine-protein kinase
LCKLVDRFAPKVNPKPLPKPPFFWLALSILVVTLIVTVGATIFIARHWNEANSVGVVWTISGDTWTALRVRPGSSGEGKVLAGDAIVAINGDTRAAYLGQRRWFENARIGDRLEYRLMRGGRIVTVDLEVTSNPVTPGRFVSGLFIGSTMLLMAGLMGLLKPRVRTTQIGFWAGVVGSFVFIGPALAPWSGNFPGWARWIPFVFMNASPWQFPLGYHFFSVFPAPPVGESRIWIMLRWLLYAFALFLWLPTFLWELAEARGLDIRRTEVLTPGFARFFDAVTPTVTPLFWTIAGAAMLAVVIRNYRALTDEGERRRVRLAAMGVAPPLFMLALLGSISAAMDAIGFRFIATSTYRFMAATATALVATGPLTLAYAVLKHRLMGIRFVIRRGLQYLLAKNFLSLVLLLPVFVLLGEVATHPERTIIEIFRQTSLTFLISVSVAAALSLRYRGWILDWLDRRFFRTAYSQEKILMELLDEVQQAESLNEISQMVANKVTTALHPKDLFIFYCEDATRGFTVGYPEDARADVALKILREQEILNLLDSGANSPFIVSAYAEASSPDLGDLPKSSLIVPLNRPDQRLAGVLWLDEKMSEEPYSARDKDLLQMIAGQIAVVHENLRLKEQLADEQRVRINVLSHLDERSVNLLKECPSCGRCYDRSAELCAVDGIELTTPIPVERVVEKKYRLDRRLGSGGMGGVYEATDLRLNRTVALKVMVGRLFGNRVALRRFEREARTSARLRHPNIVTIHDFGRLQGEGAYLVMEHLPGISWRSALSQRRFIPGPELASWIDQLGSAVTAAHAAGVIHRDLKPENLIVSPQPNGSSHITVLDFGLAKIREMEIAEAHSSQLTATGVVMGTLRYMAPEQLAGKEVDPKSDIYSLGLILIESLFGGFPNKVREIYPWIETATNAAAARHPSWNSADDLQRVLKTLLAAEPEHRCGSFREIQRELISLLQSYPPMDAQNEPAASGDTRTIEF